MKKKTQILIVNFENSAIDDYCFGVKTLGPHADFIVLNISCPNVKWTSKMESSEIEKILYAVKAERDLLPSFPPLLLKLGPDMSAESLQEIAKIAKDHRVDGLVMSNTTKSRPSCLQNPNAKENGGLSGKPLGPLALESLRTMYRLTNGEMPIVGVGGIMSSEDAYERIRAGASLIQIYTALVFEGPGLIQRIHHDLAIFLERDGFSNIQEAVGADVRLGQQKQSMMSEHA